MSSGIPGEELVAGPDDEGRRLDKVLRSLLPELALSEIYAALRKGKVRVNGRKASPEQRLAEGDRILFRDGLSPRGRPAPVASGAVNEEGEDNLEPLSDILILATKDLLFINKPRGELSQDAEGESATIADRISAALAHRRASSLSFAPGPLHRLDRNTSGLITFPRSATGARTFSALVRERKLEKRYLALVDGEVGEAAEWRDRLTRDEDSRTSRILREGEGSGDAGSLASASMRPLIATPTASLVLVELHTGLTHQIRAQASSRGRPLSGDAKYGGSAFPGGYILHAFALGFPEPPFPDVPALVVAPLPLDARARLGTLFGAGRLDAALTAALN
jgi:Pseudouridylate synthases, 23S RNA-specific